MSERGTGRTKSMVEALPDHCVVIVHSHDFRRYVELMIADLRGKTILEGIDVRAVSDFSSADRALRGRRCRVIFDHAFFDCVRPPIYDYARALAGHVEAVLAPA